jgi:hypothetical protein
MFVIVFCSGLNFVYYRNVNHHFKKVHTFNVTIYDKSCVYFLRLECLTTLYQALIYSRLNVTQVTALFFLSETILFWLKNDAVLETYLTSTELKLLKVNRIWTIK